MHNVKRMLFAALLLFAAAGCKKEINAPASRPASTSVDPSKVYKIPVTPEEKLLVQNLSKVTEIFMELYKDNSNVKLVNAAIYSKAYTDESVLIKDLIYPSQSRLTKVNRFNELCLNWGVSLNVFADHFWRETNKRNDQSFLDFLGKIRNFNSTQDSKMGGLEDDQPSIYFPYSEEFLPANDETYAPITSIATATMDADEGWGNLPYYLNNVFQYYVQVLVNDDYVFANPTHIVGVNGIEEVLAPNDINEPPPPPPPPPGVSRVYIGEGLCKDQYDRLISFTGNGGGSEIKYCHLTGYLQPVNGQVTTFQDIVSVDFSRYQIRKKKWVRNFTVWDDDWIQNDLEQFLGIYEEDNTNTRTFNGSVGTTLTVDSGSTITGNIGFSITVQSQDDIIRQLKISRNSYFAGAFQNQAWGFSSDATFLPLPYTHGWPYFDTNGSGGANVGWTWPYNTF